MAKKRSTVALTPPRARSTYALINDVLAFAECATWACDGNEEPLYTEEESERIKKIIEETRRRLFNDGEWHA